MTDETKSNEVARFVALDCVRLEQLQAGSFVAAPAPSRDERETARSQNQTNKTMSEWIKVSERLPSPGDPVLIIFEASRAIGIARYFPSVTTGKAEWFDAAHGTVEYEPDYWQPLPDLPPRVSSFDQWWNMQECLKDSRLFSRSEIKAIWDAAVAAAKRPDFVP